MATPDFILALREKVGTAPLWLSGATAVVLTPQRDRALFVRRSDNGEWTPVTGIIDPLEHPARAALREIEEETGVRARVLHLVAMDTVGPMTYPNGDEASYLDLAFVCEWKAGEPHPADGENTEARWFPADQPPPMNTRFTRVYARALEQLENGVTTTDLPADVR
ncbi:NUDIX domain-containing protein [Helcobacillus massiliensis]|uniref:NUDIX hydrolase n=1 Tax=Helcobacillus massiliensis TaxID=521392 RepID=UPI0021A8B5D4|nr:NUDIX domain-containing protein [Helcobacillus massiliensis]MCT1557023.1 NUDIX domain-containing protein [Helcobacillus massiliensis]MCT2035412.1 NUDIX domain-containing protein [Helcobacillus massiliensis]MCT2331373.1 NUDIX domain-containing protein [Helcobacillus massiliensis]